jgi:hypothetical protein
MVGGFMLRLYNVGWNAKAKNPSLSLFHNVGECQVFANTEAEAFKHATEALDKRFRRSLDWINVDIVFIEELEIKDGVLDYRTTLYGDLNNKGKYKPK